MSDPFVAEIRIFGLNFAPRGWAFCSGQLMPLSQNTALFSLVGTFYGGNGKTTFALPDLQGSAPMHPGQGPGLSLHDLGEQGGVETVTLIESEIPAHFHALNANTDNANVQIPNPSRSLARSVNANAYKAPSGQPVVDLAPNAVSPGGGDAPHTNMQPYLALNFCIALEGIYPPRG